MYEGVPGSGKSYHAVSEKILKWVRAGRRIYIFVDGFYLDRLALFEGLEQAELEKQITVWNTAEEVRAGLLQVQPGSAVVIDEVQSVFRSKEKTDPEILRWLETHRHRGVDMLMMCQQYGQVTLGVNRLIETTTKFRRLDRFGLKNRYQAAVRGNPEETEVIRMFSGRYQPKIYAYYSSYSSGAIRETARGGSIMRSPMVIVGAVALLGAVGWFSTGRWLTPSADVVAQQEKHTEAVTAVKLPPPTTQTELQKHVEVERPVLPAIHPVHIQGGMKTEVDGSSQWLYVTNTGRIMTDDEIAQESGGIVNARMDRGVRRLYGSGVVWGGGAESPREITSGALLPPTIQALAGTDDSSSNYAHDEVTTGQGESKSSLVTPPGILPTPPGILTTPQ